MSYTTTDFGYKKYQFFVKKKSSEFCCQTCIFFPVVSSRIYIAK